VSDTYQDPDGDWSEPSDFILRDQHRAQAQALTSLDEDPQKAARAVDLGEATGVPPVLVHGDLENFEQQHKAALTSSLLKNNQFLAQYANSDPMAAKVSNDDWGQLDEVSQKLMKLRGGVLDAPTSIVSEAAKGFKEGFGTEPYGSMIPTDTPGLNRLSWALWQTLGDIVPLELMNRTFSGVVGGFHGAAAEAYRQFGGDPNKAEQFARETAALVEAEAGGLSGRHAVGEPVTEAVQKAMGDRIQEAVRLAKPYLDQGEVPPVGLHPVLDQFHSEQAKADAQALDDALAESEKSATRERSPDLFANFIRQHTDAKIGVSAEAVRKLYGDEEPSAEDGKLGWVSGIAEQLRTAEASGGDVEIPLADWLAKVDPDVAKELHDEIRVRPGGMTIEESKEGEKPVQLEEAKGEEQPEVEQPEVTPVDSIRTASHLDPLFAEGWDQAEPGPAERGIIPPSAKPYEGEAGTTVAGDTISPYLNFPLKDALKQIDKSKLTGIPAVLHEFYSDRLSKLVGDVPIHVVKDAEMREFTGKLFQQKGDKSRNYALAFYNPSTDEIYMSDKVASGAAGHQYAAYAVMHEGAHALSVHAMEENPELKAKVVSMMGEVAKFIAEEQPDLMRDSGHAYAFKNEKEFWAQAWSDVPFQHTLSTIPLSDKLAKDIGIKSAEGKSIYDAFRKIVKLLMQKLFPGLHIPDTMIDGLFHLQHQFEQIEAKERGAKLAIAPAKPLEPELPGMTRLEDRDLFSKAAAIGMTKDQYQKYMKLIDKRQAEDLEHHQAQAEKIEREHQTKEWKENFDRVHESVKSEIRNRPDIAADLYLREGELYGEKAGKVKLARSALTPEQVQALPKGYVDLRGAHPDDIAGFFSYHSGDGMISALERLNKERELEGLTPAAHLSKLVDAETERQMRKTYGNLEENILAEAKDHVISQTQLDLLHEEMLALGTRAHGEMSISKEDVKGWVKDQFDSTVGHSTDKYLANAGRAGATAEQALLEGSPADAFKAKQQQYISMLLANEAKKLEKEQASFNKLKPRLLKREIPSLPEEYTNFIHQLLMQGGEFVKRTVQDLQERKDKFQHEDLQSFAAYKSEKYGLPILFPDFVYDESWHKTTDQMTPDEFRGWSQAIRALYNFGRDENKVIRLGDKEDLAELRGKMVEQLKQQGTQVIKLNKSTFKNITETMQTIAYKLVQMESIWNRFDQGNSRGLFNTTFQYQASEAVNDYSALVKKYSAQLATLNKYTEGKKMHEKVAPLFRRPSSITEENPAGDWIDMTRENVLGVLQNIGNDSNFTKLAGGYLPKDQRTKEGIAQEKQRILAWLGRNGSKDDLDFVRAQGKINESIFHEYEKMVTSQSQVPAQRVELRPVQTPWGTVDGWYHPVIWDRLEEGSSEKLMGKSHDDSEPLQDSGYFRASTPKGFEKQRTGYLAPIYLGLDRNAARMTAVLRDSAIRPFVINSSKLIYDLGFRQAVLRHGGEVIRDMLDPYLKRIAGQGEQVSRADAVMDKTLEFFRRNLVSRLIGANIHTVSKHGMSAAINSMGEVGPMNIARELANLRTTGDLDPVKSNWEWAMDNSQELQRRMQHWYETAGGAYESLKGKTGFREWLAEKGSAPIAFFDQLSAVPTFIAEYKKQIEALTKEDPNPVKNHGLAVGIAERAVRRAHGSSAVSSRPSAMSGSALGRTFTSLYGFFNQMLQRNYEAMWRSKQMAGSFKEGEYQKGLEQIPMITKLLVMGNLSTALVEEMVTPYTNSEHDSWAKWAVKSLAMASSGTVPLVREAVHAWVEGFDTTVGMLDTGMRGLKQTVSDVAHGAKAFDAQHGGKTIKELNSLFGTLTGWSNDEIGNLAKTGWDVTHRSKETPRSTGELLREATTGHARRKQ
jgi:hypothetical protein